MRKQKVLIIGKPYTTDYTGSKTLYIWNALSDHQIDVSLFDITSGNDTPPGCTHAIYVDWIHLIDEGWANLVKHLNVQRKILYTDNWHWYEQCRNDFMTELRFDLEQIFTTVALASSENVRWWPPVKFDHWGVVVDEDMATYRRTSEDYIYVDEVWPEQWSNGEFTAKHVFDIAIPQIKKEFGVSIVSQKTDAEWVDHLIEPNQELPFMLDALAKSKCFIVSHEEALGLMQFEAQVCGIPVVTNPSFSKKEVYETGEGCTFNWTWGKKEIESENEDGQKVIEHEVDTDPEKAAEKMVQAVKFALRADRTHIRQCAIERYGKKAWFERIDL